MGCEKMQRRFGGVFVSYKFTLFIIINNLFLEGV